MPSSSELSFSSYIVLIYPQTRVSRAALSGAWTLHLGTPGLCPPCPPYCYHHRRLLPKKQHRIIAYTRLVSNKVDIARFWLQNTAIHYDFSFDGYLHLRWLWNYGGRVHISLLLVQILSKKWQRR